MNSPSSAVSVPSARAPARELLDRRVAVPGVEVLLATRERALHRPARALRELDPDVRVVAGVVLRAEAAAHVVADDAHLVPRQAERVRDLLADAPDELRRDVDDELVAFPLAHRLVRLQRVVQHRLRPVRRLDDDVGLGEAAGDVAAVVRRAARSWSFFCATACSGSSIGSSCSNSTSSSAERGARLRERVGRDGGDRLPLEVRLGHECAIAPGSSTARTPGASSARDASNDLTRARANGERSTATCSIPGSCEVGRVDRLAGRALEPVLPRRRPADDVERAVRPLVERIFLDDEPDLLEASFDFLLGADQSRHVRMASSIFGVRPATAEVPGHRDVESARRSGSGRLDERRRRHDLARRAEAALHARRSGRRRATIGCSRRPSIVVISRPSTVCASVMHESVGTPSTCTVHAPQ